MLVALVGATFAASVGLVGARGMVGLVDIDEGARTDLALEANEYDPSPSANYESWLLLEPIPAPAPAASA